jgi:hypothetical protein
LLKPIAPFGSVDPVGPYSPCGTLQSFLQLAKEKNRNPINTYFAIELIMFK